LNQIDTGSEGQQFDSNAPIAVMDVLLNMSGIGPFGTYSFSKTARYTDTSSLPLGFEKAAIFASRIGELKHGVNERNEDFAVASAAALTNPLFCFLRGQFVGLCGLPRDYPGWSWFEEWVELEQCVRGNSG
jgi:hypothetical protein